MKAPLRPLRARDYQRPDDTARQIAEKRERALASAVSAALDAMRASVSRSDIAAALRAGNYAAVLDAVPHDRLAEGLKEAFERVIAIHHEAARAAAAEIPAKVRKDLAYDALEPNVVVALQSYRVDLMTDVTDASRKAVASTITGGMDSGLSVDEIAGRVANIVGLTERQAAAVVNFRRLLEQGDPAALERQLRDRRFDSTVEAAIAGEEIDPDKIDQMVDRYAERYVDFRAKTIARTESLRAANNGVRAAYQQAENRGLGTMIRFWQVAPDERVCVLCRSIPLMNPDGVGLGEPYDSIDGPVDGPQDTHPSCRCSEAYGREADSVAESPTIMMAAE